MPSIKPNKNIGNNQMTNIATHPAKVKTLPGIPMMTNFFKFKFIDSDKRDIFKYSVVFTPEIDTKMSRLKTQIFRSARKSINEDFGRVVYEGNSEMYFQTNVEEAKEYQAKVRDTDYTVKIKWVQAFSSQDKDNMVFYGVFMNHVFSCLHLKQIGRKHFNTDNAINLTGSNLKVMPGYASSLDMFETGPMVTIDISHRVLREETALQLMNSCAGGGNKRTKIQQMLKSEVVLTQYNKNSTYTITDVMFDMSPKSTFSFFDKKESVKKEISYMDYYKKLYDIEISDPNQPLLEHFDKKQRRKIFLIPELCKMTGLSDKQRTDFRLMKNMATITHKSAENRLKDIKTLFDLIRKSEKCKELMTNWNVSIDENPLEAEGHKLNIGEFVMAKKSNGSRMQFAAEGDNNQIDRNIQSPMYDQKSLKKWAFIYKKKCKREADMFLSELKKCFTTYNFQVKPPHTIEVYDDSSIKDEILKMKDHNPETIGLVLILIDGPKLANHTYNEIKELTFSKIPIPTQCVNTATIRKNKNMRSICNRILMQINSKLGGAPWAISDLPFSDVPTMVVGINVYKKSPKSSVSILSCTMSMNARMNMYTTI